MDGAGLQASFSAIVKQIIERVSLKEVVEEYVRLERAGREYRGLCPFHAEKNPSFYVNETKRFFYCFGCQTGGDAIKFLELAAGLSFEEALERLARKAGIELPKQREKDFAKDNRKAEILHANAVAQEVFKTLLRSDEGKEARAYLLSRGITEELWERFGLGFGGQREGTLLKTLRQRGVLLDAAIDASLIFRQQNDYGERFLGRILFPIYNLDGAVIAFSGRIIKPDDETPKYLNSKESLVFHKGMALFGLYQARPAFRQKRACVICEGNFDCLALFAAGIENAVAPLGSALSIEQLQTLKRFVSKVYLMFDGDEAGQKATRRSVPLLLESELEGFVCKLERNHDPHSLWREKGAEALHKAIERATPIISWFARSLLEIYSKSPHGISNALRDAKTAFASEKSPIRYALYIEELAKVFGVEPSYVRRAMRTPSIANNTQAQTKKWASPEITMLELFVLYPYMIDTFVSMGGQSWFLDEETRRFFGHLLELRIKGEDDIASALARKEGERSEIEKKVMAVLACPQMYPESEAWDCFERVARDLERRRLEHDVAVLVERMEQLRRDGQLEEERELQKEVKAMRERINELLRGGKRESNVVG